MVSTGAEDDTHVNPYARPADAEAGNSPPPGTPETNGPARRLAGALLIANALLVLLWIAVAPPAKNPNDAAFMLGSKVGSFLPALIDLAIGVSIVRGSPKLVPWAIVRCVVGVLLSAGIYLQKDPFSLVQGVALAAALVALLAGRAGPVRTAIAGSAAGLSLLTSLIIIAGTAIGTNPLTSLVMAASGDIEPSPAGHVTGRAAPYELTFPNDSWHARTQAATTRDNVLADRWILRPDKDAHVIVIAERSPDKLLAVDAYADAILGNLEKIATGVKVLSRGPWPAYPENGRLVRAEGMREGTAFEWQYGIVTVYERAYYVTAFATKEAMPALDAEMQAILASFKLPEALLRAMPPELEPLPATTVRGNLLPYTLTAPSDRWHLRKPEATKKENAIIDQMLSRPQLDTHVLVIAEQVDPGQVIDLATYVDNVLASIEKGAEKLQILKREPWAKFPRDGVRVHLSVRRNSIDLEYEYGLYARGNRAFQIAGFASQKGFAAAQEEMARLIDSFEPPPP